MKTINYLGLVGLAAASLFASQAFATTCPAGFSGSPTCIRTNGSEASLQTILGAADTPGSIFSAGKGINPYTDQLNPASYWAVGGTGSSENTVMLTLTSNASTDVFGIYDPSNIKNTLVLFDGGASGYTTSLKTNGTGGFAATYYASSNPLAPPSGYAAATFGDGNLFGYYLDVGNTVYYSDPKLNSNDTARDVTYAGNGSNTIKMTNGVFGKGEYLQAWEDGTDFGYNDFLVQLESVHPVPEPATLGMFGLGALLIGFAVNRRRREDV